MTGLSPKSAIGAPATAGAFCANAEDTIAAIATPAGSCGVSIVRLSGPSAAGITDKFMTLRRGTKVADLRPWSVALGTVLEPESGREVDEALVIVMRGPRSYTGEDVVEVQCHGGRLVTEKILSLALRCGARAAYPGEFTRRAYLSGRITLDQAEAVLDLIEAPSESSLLEAAKRLKGDLGERIRRLDATVLDILSALLAAADFPEDVEDQSGVFREIDRVRIEIRELLDAAPLGLALTTGIEVCLVGRPNAGKSSLFNALLGKERAIVTDIPGTTRDVLREKTEWGGLPVTLLDTAGLRETSSIVEALGVERAREAAAESEVILYVVDGAVPLSDEDAGWLARWKDRKVLLILSKADLLGEEKLYREDILPGNTLRVSTISGMGIEKVKETVIEWFSPAHPEGAIPGSARQVDCLRRAEAALEQALGRRQEGWTEDVVVLHLEEAAAALSELTGKRVSQEALDRIFSRFCVGK